MQGWAMDRADPRTAVVSAGQVLAEAHDTPVQARTAAPTSISRRIMTGTPFAHIVAPLAATGKER